MSPPGASWRVVMPRVALTRGQLARGDARGEPHPTPLPGYIINYMGVRRLVNGGGDGGGGGAG